MKTIYLPYHNSQGILVNFGHRVSIGFRKLYRLSIIMEYTTIPDGGSSKKLEGSFRNINVRKLLNIRIL